MGDCTGLKVGGGALEIQMPVDEWRKSTYSGVSYVQRQGGTSQALFRKKGSRTGALWGTVGAKDLHPIEYRA